MKAISLISGGIDSPVASCLAIEQGTDVVFVHYTLYPYAAWQIENKTREIVKAIANKYKKKFKLLLVPFGKVSESTVKGRERKYQCLMCRRMMLRVASKIVKMKKADAIVTGESLGQVASQTLPNMSAEHNAATVPVIRPLLGMDKLEIENLGKKLGTYEISILPGSCCRLTPDRPATRATKEKIEEHEKDIDIEKLVKQCIAGKKEIWVKPD